jgi:CheY-like chemotaxis protein
MDAGERVSFDTDMDFPAGRRLAKVTLSPVTSAAGAHLLACMTDVTKEKTLEAAQQAEAKRKDEFLAMLAHELRNPLVPIRNVAHLLAKDQVAATKSRELGLLVERQAKHLTRLVDDLLDVSRITRGVLELNRERLAPDDIVLQASEMLTVMLGEKRQTLQVRLQAPGTQVFGDRARLVQVVTNLLSNASKYSPEDAAIELLVERQDRSVVMRVVDRGEGIHPQMLPTIFELFVQADKSLDRRNGGLGVGLTIAKRLVELHGGEIEVHSAGLGQGSEFIVRLPIDAPSQSDASIVPSPSADAEPARSADTTRVMIVDDSVSAAATLALLLEIEGFEVRTSHDGRTALEALESYEPQVILLDIGLPDIDGYLVAQAVRERYASRAIRIIAVTGYGTAADRELALRSGFDVHLTKPVEPELLLSTIRDVRAPGDKAAAATPAT